MKTLNDAECQSLATTSEWASLAASWLQKAGEVAVERRGVFALALSGGHTPGPVYRRFKNWPDKLRHNTRIFWVDERAVSSDHPASNYGIYSKDLEGIFKSIHPIPASRFERYGSEFNDMVKATLRAESAGTVIFDALVMGMGRDGHTASLFSPPRIYSKLGPGPYIMTGVHQGHARVSLRYEELRAAQYRLFLIHGEEKGVLLERLKRQELSGVPISFLYPAKSTDLWLIKR